MRRNAHITTERAICHDTHMQGERASFADTHRTVERAIIQDTHTRKERASAGDTHMNLKRANRFNTRITIERAKTENPHKFGKRANDKDTHKPLKRANLPNKGVTTNHIQKPMSKKSKIKHAVTREEKERNRQILRLLVRSREDFQFIRKAIDNRMGRKADGSEQNVAERQFSPDDLKMLEEVADASRDQETAIEKKLLSVLRRFPIWTEWLANVKGVGTIAGAVIISEIDIHIADTVSKIWQFAGLNPSPVVGKKRVENKDGTFSLVATTTMVRGDKLTAGFVAPFNKKLRTALCGVLADGFIKAQAPHAMEYYYPYKARLEQSENEVEEISVKGGKPKRVEWKDAKKAHRDRAAKRYMIKFFIRDLYEKWRELEGLEVRPPYQEEYLGKKHRKAG